MKRKIGVIFILMILILNIGSYSQQNKAERLSLEDCIIGAMKDNLRVAIEVLNPDIADYAVTRANEKYLPLLSFGYNNRETNTASYSWIDAADQVRSAYNDYNISLNQLIPTGGNLNVSLSSYKNDTNRSFQTINPRYGSTLDFNFTQPLLKNFGFKINRREIIIANNNREISENQFHETLLDTIYNVEEAYWNLVYSIEDLNVKKQSLQLARDLLEENKRKIEVGTMPPIEIYTAESEVANREADILQADRMVKTNQDRLKTILNRPILDEGELTEIIPSDKPVFERRKINLDEALNTALTNRPDLKASQIDIENWELNLGYASNQLLPDLNFNISYWSPGISGVQILYKDNNPLSGIIVGTLPGGSSDALKDAFDFRYKNWSVGLTLNVPLNTIFTRARYAETKLGLQQARLRLENQEKLIYLEIKTAVRDVEINYQRVEAYRAARELAVKKLEAEQEKFRVGKSTNFFILQYQRDVANARTAELKSTVDYLLSLARLDRALGTTLATKEIIISDILPGQEF
jgi:outer membrane protein TolC